MTQVQRAPGEMRGWGAGPNLLPLWEKDTHKLKMVSLVHRRQSRVSDKMRAMTGHHLMGTGGGGGAGQGG